jgi:hypothetical protein
MSFYRCEIRQTTEWTANYTHDSLNYAQILGDCKHDVGKVGDVLWFTRKLHKFGVKLLCDQARL